MRQDVEADCLAALMVLDRKLEPVPEPFRMQPGIQLVVNFEEYLCFVPTLPAGRALLYFPIDKLCKAIDTRNEPSMLRAFYIDMALAVCKELFFAEYYNKGATAIYHEFYNCHDVKTVPSTEAAGLLLRQIAKGKGFALPENISTLNRKHWDYACKLMQDASTSPTRWVEKR